MPIARARHGRTTWVPEATYDPKWVHARTGGCGEFPRSSNPDRVTCPRCLTPKAVAETTVVDD